MSRSYKKHGIIKDGGGYWKVKSNQIFRRRNKVQLKTGQDFFQRNELVNQWDICDYKFRWEAKGVWMAYSYEDPGKMKRRYFNK